MRESLQPIGCSGAGPDLCGPDLCVSTRLDCKGPRSARRLGQGGGMRVHPFNCIPELGNRVPDWPLRAQGEEAVMDGWLAGNGGHSHVLAQGKVLPGLRSLCEGLAV